MLLSFSPINKVWDGDSSLPVSLTTEDFQSAQSSPAVSPSEIDNVLLQTTGESTESSDQAEKPSHQENRFEPLSTC